MGWLRARRKLGGLLALVALALQLVLAFGHSHAEDVAAAQPGLATIQPAAIGDSGGGERHQEGGHDGCAICATVHLAGTLLLPVPPGIALPPSLTSARLDAPASQARTAAITLSFQARAPPQA